MADKGKKNGFSMMNVVLAAGAGSATGFAVERINNNVAFFGSNPWVAPLVIAAGALGVDYFTSGKNPYIVGGIAGAAGLQLERAAETAFQGYSSVNGAQKKMDKLLEDIKKFRGKENNAIHKNLMPPGGSKVENANIPRPAMYSKPANNKFNYQANPQYMNSGVGIPSYDYCRF